MKDLIEFGDCREIMRQWARDGVKAQTCVTSPPYFGLRDYGHDGQIGLEQTPDEYIAAMVDVFRCVRDVLTDDGTVWLNVGDSYFSTVKGTGGSGKSKLGPNRDLQNIQFQKMNPIRINSGRSGCKPKDLIGIPWMLAFALRADGWYLRQDIIWHKPNPMPEPVRDRCTKAHEYIFLLSKSQKYYFDGDSIKEPSVGRPSGNKQRKAAGARGIPDADPSNVNGGVASSVPWDGRENKNKRDVWSVSVKGYKGAHFAVFPPELITPCVLAGCPEGGVVLDPFMGSGTTAMVAKQSGRHYLGCELNPEYQSLQKERLDEIGRLF